MSNLVRCPTCGHGISINATRCPRCGENDFIISYPDYTEVNDVCTRCNGVGAITISHDPLKDKTNLLGNGGHDTYNPTYQKVRQQNPIKYTSDTCSRCNGYGYTIRQVRYIRTVDRRLKY